MTAGGNLFAQQAANRKASRRLVAGFIFFVAWLGFGGDLIWYLASRNSVDAAGLPAVHWFPGIGIFLTIFASVIAWSTYRFGATILLKATGAREIDTPSTELEQRLVNVVEEMSIAAGNRKPRVWLVPGAPPHAFAAGIKAHPTHKPGHAGV